MDTNLQKKIAKTIMIAVTEVFQKEFSNEFYPNLVSVGNVKVTPDLQLARIYVSCFPEDKIQNVMKIIELDFSRIKFLVHSKIKNKLRKMPELEFYVDDTLIEQEKVNHLMDKIKQEEERIRNLRIEKGLSPESQFDESAYKDLEDLK
jgi:ribosome-binding factor A